MAFAGATPLLSYLLNRFSALSFCMKLLKLDAFEFGVLLGGHVRHLVVNLMLKMYTPFQIINHFGFTRFIIIFYSMHLRGRG